MCPLAFCFQGGRSHQSGVAADTTFCYRAVHRTAMSVQSRPSHRDAASPRVLLSGGNHSGKACRAHAQDKCEVPRRVSPSKVGTETQVCGSCRSWKVLSAGTQGGIVTAIVSCFETTLSRPCNESGFIYILTRKVSLEKGPRQVLSADCEG